jgi:hypothetical protein
MAGDDAVGIIDQDRIDKPVSPDGLGDLGNLLVGVGTGIGSACLHPGKRPKAFSGLVLLLASFRPPKLDLEDVAPANTEIIQDKTAAIIMKRFD